jgi:membrane protease YdiL (CAAX protease family)
MSSVESLLRFAVPALLALGAAVLMDRLCASRGLLPPGFREPWRRGTAIFLVALVFGIGVFAPLGNIGLSLEPDLSQLTTPQLFLLHMLLLLTVGGWFLLGFAGVEAGGAEGGLGRRFLVQLGLAAPNVPGEIGLGVVLGLAAWVAVLLALLVVGGALLLLGGEDAVPKAPPALVPWIAALPIGVRILVSLSAGFVEEIFFRGFLQPRIGIALSTSFFVLAHFSYGQPFMLVGITILSLIYAYLVQWRQNVWPAIAAHVLFDAVQLLVVIPSALRLLDQQGVKATACLGLF